MPGTQRRWTDDDFVRAVARCTNFTDVLRALGLRPAGGNHRAMRRAAERLGVELAHFTDERRLRGLRAARERGRRRLEDVFCRGSSVNPSILRKRARRLLAPIRCEARGNTGERHGAPLTLQLDHRNGIRDDNRLENLRWLCPNRHSQTATFAGRGPRRAAVTPPERRAPARVVFPAAAGLSSPAAAPTDHPSPSARGAAARDGDPGARPLHQPPVGI